MCGITGIYNFKTLKPADGNIIYSMNKAISYRGPDNEGIHLNEELALGHRRLSIIDLSEAANQPLPNEDCTIWLVFNGEIYNYVELIPELIEKGHIFKSKTDSEVIIHAYEEWGEDCLKKFNGMFAFALWDETKKKLFLARDRIGVKPLYYTFDDDGIIFASEIKALLKHPNKQSPSLEPQALYNYIRESFVAGEKTFFKDIFKLKAGHFIVIDNANIKEHCYWKLPVTATGQDLSEKEYVEKLRELIIDAVKIRLRSDVPVGFHLSGGLDSSSIVSIASKFFDVDVRTFSGRFSEAPEYDEGYFIDIVSKNSKTTHSEIIAEIGKNFPEDMKQAIYMLDEPVVGPGVLPQIEVCKMVKNNGVTVVLGGQGADEILAGYDKYLTGFLRSYPYLNLFKNKNFKEFNENLSYNKTLIQNTFIKSYVVDKFPALKNVKNKVFSKEFLNTIDISDTNYNNYLKLYPEISSLKLTDFEKMLHYDAVNYLHGLLHVEDRTSMAVSLESRTPFVDYRILEFAFQMPSSLKIKNLFLKYMLRKAMKDILPEEIRKRKDKKGFPTPINLWFKTTQKDYLNSLLFSSKFKERNLFDPAYIQLLFNEHLAGKDHSLKLWPVLNTEIWFQTFIDN